MGAARIAPGLALLLCCPVLSSAYALVSLSPSTFKHKNPGVALGSLGECRRKDLGSPNSLNFGMVPPRSAAVNQKSWCLLSLGCLNYRRFQLPEVSPLLKTWLGVLGLEICGWSFPTPCFCEHTALVVCISFDGDSVIQRALGVESHRLRWGPLLSQVLFAPDAQSCVQEV